MQFTLNDEELCQRDLVVKMGYNGKDEIEIIRISLYLIVNGPYHHNLQIALGKELFRVMFDAKISHIFETTLGVEEFKVSTPSRVNVNSWRFAIKAMVHLIIDSIKMRKFRIQTLVMIFSHQPILFSKRKHPSNISRRQEALFSNCTPICLQKNRKPMRSAGARPRQIRRRPCPA